MDTTILWFYQKELLLKQNFLEEPITKTIKANFEDPTFKFQWLCLQNSIYETRDARVLDFISTILSDGKSSRLYKKIVDDKRWPCKLVRLAIIKKIMECTFFMVYRKPKHV
jgi:hypothetical protein